jgi:hypothetical protein
MFLMIMPLTLRQCALKTDAFLKQDSPHELAVRLEVAIYRTKDLRECYSLVLPRRSVPKGKTALLTRRSAHRRRDRARN